MGEEYFFWDSGGRGARRRTAGGVHVSGGCGTGACVVGVAQRGI